MEKNTMNCETARNLCAVSTLIRLGHLPQRESEREAWYLSPFREETKASLKVCKRLNRWYDHGAGIGGNTLDLVTALKGCSVKEALAWLAEGEIVPIFQRPRAAHEKQGAIRITGTREIEHPALVQYLRHRGIPAALARDFVSEVDFEIGGRRYFALGLKNDLDGWELRSKYHKHCASPKAVAHLRYGHDRLCVVEGMFDLLSLVKLDPKWARQADILVLNSLALVQRSMDILSKYKCLELSLDNDPAGDRATGELLRDFPNAVDRREFYAGHKDLSDKIMGHGSPIGQ